MGRLSNDLVDFEFGANPRSPSTNPSEFDGCRLAVPYLVAGLFIYRNRQGNRRRLSIFSPRLTDGRTKFFLLQN